LIAVGIVGTILIAALAFTTTRALTKEPPPAQTIELVAADETGAHPFTISTVDVTVQDLSRVIDGDIDLTGSPGSSPGRGSDSVSGAEVDGTEARLYASHTSSICDTKALVEALSEDPGARDAWLGLMGIDKDAIEASIAAMTPLVLTRDTAVSNSRYEGGEGVWFQAVLQAGTPVLVDSSGVPRIKCSCGNPLGPSSRDGRTDSDYIGEGWDRFDPDNVITIKAAKGDLKNLETVDLSTGKAATTSVGGTISLDGYLVQNDDGVSVVSPDGERTVILDTPVAQFADDGNGGLVFQLRRSTSTEYSQPKWELVTSTPNSADEAAIWHLPPGTTEPVAILTSDDPQRRWFALQGAGELSGRPAIVYNTVDRDPTRGEEAEYMGRTILRYLDDGTEHVLFDQISYYEGAPGQASFAGDRVAIEVTYEFAAFEIFDAEGRPVLSGCPDPTEPSGCESTSVLRSSQEFFGLHSEDQGSMFYNVHVIDVATATKIRTLSGNPEPEEMNPPQHVDADGNRAIISWTAVGPYAATANNSALVDIDKDLWTDLGFTGETRLLRSPLLRPAQP